MAVQKSNYNGWYKVQYGEKNNAIPSWSILQKLFAFQKRAKTGKSYNEPVKLTQSHGVTIRGGTSAGTVYNYNSAISPQTEELSVTGCEITLNDRVAIGAVAAAAGGDVSFGALVDDVVIGLTESHRFYLECGLAYGQTSIGEIDGTPATDGSNKVLTISKKTWAPGIWAQSQNMKLDAYTAPGGTKRTANAPLVVVSIDPDLRKITVSGNATDLGNLADDDVLMPYEGDGTAGLFTGLDKVATNTGSLHGISATTYSLWKGNVHDAADSPLTMGIIHAATVKGVVRGLQGRFTWLVNTYSWQNLLDNENALRRYAGDQNRELVQGAESVAFIGANGAKMEIVHHPMLKAGEAFGVTPADWIRGGESDLVDQIPGTPEDQFFTPVPGTSSLEIVNFSSQFFFCRKPARQVKIKNIVPTGLA